MKKELTQKQYEIVMDALFYFRDVATHEGEVCGLKGRDKKVMNQAIDKVVRWYRGEWYEK